jgi:DNA modification methylase
MLLLGDCNDHLKDIRDNSIDLIVTDPPYGIEFMGKDWDKALVHTDTWKECYRVLKQGKLAFIMCSPRQDVLSRMIINLQDAGFRTNYTSIYWTFASGFPKAANISKLIDKKFKPKQEYYELAKYLKESREKSGLSQKDIAKYFPSATGGLTGCVSNWENGNNIPTEYQYKIIKHKLMLDDRFDWLIEQETKRYEEAEREVTSKDHAGWNKNIHQWGYKQDFDITKPATEEAKKMEGAYVGFQPKPAVEVILVVSKGKTLTWLDDCRIPYQSEDDKWDPVQIYNDNPLSHAKGDGGRPWIQERIRQGLPTKDAQANEKGRFPANLLVSDDVLNDGKITKSPNSYLRKADGFNANSYGEGMGEPSGKFSKNYGDEGSYSRYFSLDSWAKTFPFLIVPKASKSERNNGLDSIQPVKVNDGRNTPIDNPFQRGETLRTNSHPTVKPLKLMSYLITMGSREGDLVLDPFCGSGTVCIAVHQLHRKWLGIEKNPEYAEIIKKRLMTPLSQLKLTIY